ncbi:MAG: hypothetical protein KGD60_11540 [Candidatus Thorarchaeota archaeon]|nr:hypothetical protein [Candidatus Thorarchaeota archaeon]
MSLVQTYSVEALVEVSQILRERSRRCGGKCLTSSVSIHKIIERRFGISRLSSAVIGTVIIKQLVEKGMLEVWFQRPRKAIYRVVI